MLTEIADGITITHTVNINEFHQADDAMSAARSKMLEKILRKNKLISAKYAIRNLVDTANYSSGISAKLTDIARLNKAIAMYEGVLKGINDNYDEVSIVQMKLDKLRNSEQHLRDSVTALIFNNEDSTTMQGVLSEMKKSRAFIKDEVSELNITSKIQLDAFLVETLKSEKLI